MSQILADEHLGYSEVIAPLQSWITVQKIEELAPDTILKDDRVVQILRAQKQPISRSMVVFIGNATVIGVTASCILRCHISNSTVCQDSCGADLVFRFSRRRQLVWGRSCGGV